MQLLDAVVRSSMSVHDDVIWTVGVVTGIDTVKKTCTVAFGPEPDMKFKSGVGILGVPRLDQYTPTLGDIVHALSHEDNGMLIIGSAGRVVLNQVLPSGGGGTEPAPKVFTAAGTSMSENEVVQGSQEGGPQYWYFPTLYDIAAQAAVAGTRSAFTITVTLVGDAPAPAAFIMINLRTGDAIPGFEVPFYSPTLAVGVPTEVSIPLGWLYEIDLNESYTIGVEGSGRASYAVFDMAASINVKV